MPKGAARLIGESAAVTELRDLVRRVATSTSHVLVIGERGAGTELVARAIHEEGPCARADFLAVDCAAASKLWLEARCKYAEGFAQVPLESLDRARGGTVFLDDVGASSPGLQGRILAVLQSCERQVGRNGTIQNDLRFIAATHRDLDAMVHSGAFRPDLFFRLDVLRVQVPALRQRRSDIPALVRTLLASLSTARSPGTNLTLSNEAFDFVREQHDWPENLRELEDVLERLVTTVPGPEIESESVRKTLAAFRSAPKRGKKR